MDYEPTKETIDAVIGAMVDSNWVHDRVEAEPDVRRFIKAAAPFIRAQVIEECAKVATMFSLNCNPIHPDIPWAEMSSQARAIEHATCQCVAEAIHALIPAETKETSP